MLLPSRERTFYLKYAGESGFVYDGNFTIKCRLNVAEKYNYELDRSRLLADPANPTPGLYNIASAIGFLRSRIVSGPNWWMQSNGFEVEDEEVLYKIVEQVNAEIKTWQTELAKVAKQTEELAK
jgi:hypothetical protein